MKRIAAIAALAAAAVAPATLAQGAEQDVGNRSKKLVPTGPWPAGDERGMGNTIEPGTSIRCAWHLSRPKAKTCEPSQVRSNTMPLSTFSGLSGC